ncbi:MAG: ABC-type transport system involved in multi-copper enzyme maturation permease subunit [Akkermansiaceae bacterium]|jgi:ABC-type transport system involved in multi-copper enzyme maturation permease subunit
MKPYYTILLDSFRMLKSTAIFWVTLGISLLVALIYLSIGFDEKGMSLFFGLAPIENDLFRKGTPQSETLYVAIFTKLIADYWLSWIAVLMALISCASIFPEALQEGSAGMVLTKKPSRLKVFLAKFAGSLLFVTIQVVLFVAIVFVALKWRVGSWNPSIFWYVPLILLVFTYLYSFMVLVAVKTRSVMTALILTLVLWAVSSFVGWVEGQMYQGIQMMEMFEDRENEKEREVDVVKEEALAEDEDEDEDEILDEEVPEEELTEVVIERRGPGGDSGNGTMKIWHQRLVAAYAIFPKTGRTMEVADRLIVVNGEKGGNKGSFMSILLGMDEDEQDNEFVIVSEKAADRHSTGYAIGTSVAFAFIMLSLAAWIFCRKEV